MAVVLGAATGLLVAPQAQASGCAGVTVVVDFASLGGGVRTGCAEGTPASGLDALRAAGFSYAFVPRQPGFVCQINALPNPCNRAPVTAYWSYWHAQPGGSWAYSDTGAGGHVPPVGSVAGWAFGGGVAPGANP
ncbi:hypothetical protein F0L68_38460 [Solihabitans fulvus]|uniref:Lipoprotein n=1 Tax=Solihabitans fulvus TaxID=1892852 RepID=A0A5B2WJC1_9PSEU|nr:hypothetical protein F0L68_38460 [Solihabitans fulvus]